MADIFTQPITKTDKKISTPEYIQEVKVVNAGGESTYTMSFPQCLDDLTEEQRKEVLQDLFINLAVKK